MRIYPSGLCVPLVATIIGLATRCDGHASEPPNILLIVADDLGWNDVGYHNPRMRTPHLDALAESGAELDCHYVMPQCTPTRVALMTGRYPSRFGLHCCEASNQRAYPIGTPTIASILKEAGYATGMSGKWHMGSKPEWGPNHDGFDYSHGSLAGAVGMYDHRYRLNTPFANTWHRNHRPLQEVGHATDLVTGEAVRWIESHATDNRPWFFYVPFHAVHTPLVEGDLRWHRMNAHHETADRRLYGAAVSHMDSGIGEMIAALDRSGQLENTFVVFTSDNGAQVNHSGNAYPPPDPRLENFSSNAPLRGKKTETYEGGYRVPALVSWPGKIASRNVDSVLHAVDWLPTFAALAGAAADIDSLDGLDISSVLLEADRELLDRTVYIVWGSPRGREAVRRGDWKIVRSRERPRKPGSAWRPWELYHLRDDPLEDNDLAAEKPAQLQSMIETYRAERARDASPGPS